MAPPRTPAGGGFRRGPPFRSVGPLRLISGPVKKSRGEWPRAHARSPTAAWSTPSPAPRPGAAPPAGGGGGGRLPPPHGDCPQGVKISLRELNAPPGRGPPEIT